MRMFLLRLLLAALALGAPGFPAACGAEAQALYPIRQGGLWGYMDRQGNVAIAPKWAYARPFSGGMALVGGKPFSAVWTLYGHADGVIDRGGHYIVTPEDGLNIEEHAFAYRLRDTAHDDTEGFLDKASGFLQRPNKDYSTISLWDDDGAGPLAVMNSEGLTGYIDRTTGKTSIPFRYTGQSEEAGFQNGYALPADEITLQDQEGETAYYGIRYHLIDREGRDVDMPEGVVPFSRMRNGAFVYAVMADPKGQEDADPFEKGFGLMQPGGKVLIPRDPDILLMEPPDEKGMVCFLKETEKGALCGHMDSSGRVIVPPRYNISSETYDTYRFFHGYAVIEDLSANTRWVILDTHGREVFTAPNQREDGRAFELIGHVQKDGLVWYSTWKPEKRAYGVVAKTERRYGLMRVKDGRAEYLTEPVFEDYEGLSLAADNIFRETAHFAEGVQPVRQNGLWGYIDEQAEWVIPPAWHEAASFRDGLALVKKAGKLAYIDREGAVVWHERD